MSLPLLFLVAVADFKQAQLAFPRVRAAQQEKEAGLRALFAERRLSYPPRGVLLRVFKREGVLEAWVRGEGEAYVHLKDYAICATSGALGPKRREGDGQVPEGFYDVQSFNPQSTFHLALRVSYPNASDRVLGQKPLGGDIMVHGNCVTIGCVPLQDHQVKELYWLVVEAKAAGQARVPVHMFPARLDASVLAKLREERPELSDFWENLREGYALFEETHTAPVVEVDRSGRYRFR